MHGVKIEEGGAWEKRLMALAAHTPPVSLWSCTPQVLDSGASPPPHPPLRKQFPDRTDTEHLPPGIPSSGCSGAGVPRGINRPCIIVRSRVTRGQQHGGGGGRAGAEALVKFLPDKTLKKKEITIKAVCPRCFPGMQSFRVASP